MFKLKLCCVIITIAAFNGKRVVSEDVAFENVTVIASRLHTGLKFVRITSANNFQEYRWMKHIWDIDGPLRVLRKNSVTDLPDLSLFKMYNKNLEHIEPGAFKNLPSLESMTIADTSLKEIEEDVFKNLLLKRLFLEKNEITRIAPGAFDNMPNLEYIDLSNNKFTQWDPNWFQNTPRLKELVFDGHQIQELPENAFRNFRNHTELSGVSFVNGTLKTLGNNLFGGLKKVGIADFSRNKIENFGEDVLNGLETLEKLHLSDNEIECISGNFSRIFVAQTTYLINNPLILNEGCKKTVDVWSRSSQYPYHRVLY